MSETAPHPARLQRSQTVLVVVDMQEPFLRSIFEPDRVTREVTALVRGFATLGLPVIATTQAAARMGAVVQEIAEHLPAGTHSIDKLTFSCADSEEFMAELRRLGRPQVLLCGVETHICVQQTGLALAAQAYRPQVAIDAVSSRTELNYRLGVERMKQGGVNLTSVEAALYELLGQAGTPEFRQILGIIK